MKKIAIFFAVIVIIVAGMYYAYQNYQAAYRQAQKENEKFSMYIEKEVMGSELATVINKAIDYNKRNKIQEDENGNFIENEENSIKIDVTFIEDISQKKYFTHSIETIYKVGVENLLSFYGESKFECNKVEYHKTTGKIKYMLFEQKE